MAFLNDITLGQYYPVDSFVHRLDPRSKLLTGLLAMTCLLVSHDPRIMLILAILAGVGIRASHLPLRLALRNLRPFLWLFFLTFIVHVFFSSGRIALRLPLVHAAVTYEGLANGFTYCFRLALLIVMAALLTLTTSPIELTDALERLSSPLKRWKVPVHELAMMMTLSLRFIPTLIMEADRLKKAQMSRGASFGGSLVKRVKSVIPLILPLFLSAFRRADDLALAMEARCYSGGEGRSSFKALQFCRADYVVLMGFTLLFLGSLVI